jgi:hypothetical protein
MKHLIYALPTTLALAACQGPADEFRQALPQREEVTVAFPETTQQSAQGLQRQALVGAPADFYTSTYYEARKINGFGAFVVDLVETIAAYPPTTLDGATATWGWFSEAREPNEFRLVVARVEAPALHYRWRLEGRPKSGDAGLALAAGAFEPDADPELGRGWFVVRFESIRQLNPAEDGRGQVAYAFAKDEDGVAVQVLFQGPDEAGLDTTAAYAFGQRNSGEGFVTFAFPGDIHEGDPAQSAREDLLLLSRWGADGAGRADVVATRGDLGAQTLYGAQCWDERFISTFEAFVQDGTILGAQGDPATCRLEEARPEALPSAEALANPYPEAVE